MGSDTSVLGWHWVAKDRLLRNGSRLIDGLTLWHPGEIRMCASGLHGSRHALEGLRYAPGPVICRCKFWGLADECPDDKFVCRRRRVLWSYDATDVLRRFARRCALDVIHLWDAPDLVRKFLETGDETLKAIARDASWAVAWGASRAVARVAAKATVGATSRGAAKASARDASRNAAWAATWTVSRDAARAAGDAARAKYVRWLDEMLEVARAR